MSKRMAKRVSKKICPKRRVQKNMPTKVFQHTYSPTCCCGKEHQKQKTTEPCILYEEISKEICQKSPRYSVKACPKYVERAMSKEPYTL